MNSGKPKEFVVEGYIIQQDRLLLARHRKLDKWLPPGGHIEKNETPEEALIREVKEEIGLDIEILNSPRVSKKFGVDILIHPSHIQLENIGSDHQHIDLVYLCRVKSGKLKKSEENSEVRWFSLDELKSAKDILEEVKFFGELFIGLESNKISQANPVLSRIVSEMSAEDIRLFQNYSLLVVQHLQKNTIDFFRLLAKSGFKEIIVVGKPYSLNEEAVSEIRKHSRIVLPEDDFCSVRDLVKKEIDSLILRKQNFIAMDLGGDISESLNEYPSPVLEKILAGVVEDTKNSLYWLEKNEELKFPLVTVASSFMKDVVEAYFVGCSVSRNIENLFVNILSTNLVGRRILIIGFGPVGRNIALNLKSKNCIVDIFDIDSLAKVNAVINGFKVIREKNALGNYDVIIGATGRENVVSEDDVRHLKNGVVLVNASTRKREFPHSVLERLSQDSEVIKDFGRKITLYNAITIYLAADGTPINFFNNESIPNSVLDLVFSELFLSIRLLARTKLGPGLYSIESHWPELERTVADYWLDFWHK